DRPAGPGVPGRGRIRHRTRRRWLDGRRPSAWRPLAAPQAGVPSSHYPQRLAGRGQAALTRRRPRSAGVRVVILSFHKSSRPPSGLKSKWRLGQPKTRGVSDREDRWREVGVNGYSWERFRREIVIERCPLERDSYQDRRSRKRGQGDAIYVIDIVRHMAGARGLRRGAPPRHVGTNARLPDRHARRQKLSRHADDERQRNANRQETFQYRRHAGKMGG